ncbi:MAG: hypothetical protein ABH835_04610 [Patescibacteria group bacterium]|nr:hypothetical protein [Patescibacteria group bacterium]
MQPQESFQPKQNVPKDTDLRTMQKRDAALEEIAQTDARMTEIRKKWDKTQAGFDQAAAKIQSKELPVKAGGSKTGLAVEEKFAVQEPANQKYTDQALVEAAAMVDKTPIPIATAEPGQPQEVEAGPAPQYETAQPVDVEARKKQLLQEMGVTEKARTETPTERKFRMNEAQRAGTAKLRQGRGMPNEQIMADIAQTKENRLQNSIQQKLESYIKVMRRLDDVKNELDNMSGFRRMFAGKLKNERKTLLAQERQMNTEVAKVSQQDLRTLYQEFKAPLKASAQMGEKMIGEQVARKQVAEQQTDQLAEKFYHSEPPSNYEPKKEVQPITHEKKLAAIDEANAAQEAATLQKPEGLETLQIPKIETIPEEVFKTQDELGITQKTGKAEAEIQPSNATKGFASELPEEEMSTQDLEKEMAAVNADIEHKELINDLAANKHLGEKIQLTSPNGQDKGEMLFAGTYKERGRDYFVFVNNPADVAKGPDIRKDASAQFQITDESWPMDLGPDDGEELNLDNEAA